MQNRKSAQSGPPARRPRTFQFSPEDLSRLAEQFRAALVRAISENSEVRRHFARVRHIYQRQRRAQVHYYRGFDPQEPRDPQGRWVEVGVAGSPNPSELRKPVHVDEFTEPVRINEAQSGGRRWRPLASIPSNGNAAPAANDASRNPEDWSVAKKQRLWGLQRQRSLAVGAALTAQRRLNDHENSWVRWTPFGSSSESIQAELNAARARVKSIDDQIEALGTVRPNEPLLVAGDAALQWSYGWKFYKSLEYAANHGMFEDEAAKQFKELLNTLQDPEALAQFVLMTGGMVAIKKAACKFKLTPAANALFTAYEAAQVGLKASAIKSELDGITYESEVANAAPMVAELMVGLAKEIGMSELMKLLKCFPAGTQVVVAEITEPGGLVRYRTENIELLKVGDLVLAREEFGSEVRLQRIEQTFQRLAINLRVLTFTTPDGETQTIKTTDEHPFWIAEKSTFIPAGQLQPGMTVVGPNGETQSIIETKSESYPFGIPVYNFTVSCDHTYFVSAMVDLSPLLVHNAEKYIGRSVRVELPQKRPSLPAYKGKKTSGVLRFTGKAGETRDLALLSGYKGPSSRMKLKTPGMNGNVKAHVEGHAAAAMRSRRLRQATLYINRRPCPGKRGCDAMLPRMLPKGAILRVIGPNRFFKQYKGL